MNESKVPLVSICCAAYNHEPYIRQCLDGFVMQRTTFPFEVLIHDDASTDKTADIIREYEKKYPDIIKPIYQKENQYSKGGKISLRFNIPRAKGKYIAFCEGDDYWIDPLKLQKQVDFLEANPDYVFSYTNIVVDNCDPNNVQKRRFKGISGNICEFLITQGNPVATLTVCMRKDVWDEYLIEYSSWNIKMKMGDLPAWIYASMKGPVHYLPDVTAAYRVLPQSASHNSNPDVVKDFIKNATDICLFLNKRYSLGFSEKQIWKKYYRVLVIRMCEYSSKEILKSVGECVMKCPTVLLNSKVFYTVLKCLCFGKTVN